MVANSGAWLIYEPLNARCYVFVLLLVSLQKHLGFDWLPSSFRSGTLSCFVISIIISFGPWPQPICSWRKFISIEHAGREQSLVYSE